MDRTIALIIPDF
ncbi:hypothetical protein VTH06DRAFT_4764 [Thermothelomyces fergusii]